MEDRKVQSAVVHRILRLCEEQGITPNGLSYRAGISQSTIKSILNGESRNPGICTIKIICDGFEITLPEFFDDPVFYDLEQELQ